MSSPYLSISFSTAYSLPVSNIVWTFQVPILVVVRVDRTGVLLEASRWLFPPGFIKSSGAAGEGTASGLSSVAPAGLPLLRTGLFLLCLCVFVTICFLCGWVVSPSHNPRSTTEDRRCALDAQAPASTTPWTLDQWMAQSSPSKQTI